MAEFDPQSFVEDSDIPEITPGSLRYTTYGPGSPDPTPADLKEFTGNADNPLGAGDVALQPDVAKQYGLSTGDKFKYEGVTYNYADTPAKRVGNVIDIYHPASDGFNPEAFINEKEQPAQQYTVGTAGSQGVDTSTFDPHAFMASEKPAAEEPAVGSDQSPIMSGFREGLKGFSQIAGAMARRPIGVSVAQGQPFAIPTPAPPSLIPATQSGPIPGPMPTPQSVSTPYPVNAGIAQGLQQTFAGFVPHTMDQFKGLAQVMGAPTDPQGFFASAAQQGLLNAQVAQQAIKAGPFSKEAGIAYGTIIPQLAMLAGGVKGAPEGAVSSQEIPGAFAGAPPPSGRAITVNRPPPQITEPVNFSVNMPTDAFGSEQTPVAAALINDVGGVVSKSAAGKAGRLKMNADLWDDAPKMSHPTHNKIYNPQGEMPDTAAQALYSAGVISDPSVQTMWDALGKESKSSRTTLKAQRSEAQSSVASLNQQAGQTQAFAKAEQQAWQGGAPAVPVRDLQVGDKVTVRGQDFKVTDIDPDTHDVTLEDGTQFGVQTVQDGTVIYGEHESKYSKPATKFSETKGEAPPDLNKVLASTGKIDETALPSLPPEQPPPIPPLPPKPPESAGPIAPQELNPVPGSGKFIRSYRIDKALGDQMEAIGASRESGGYRAELQADNMLHELSKQQEQDLGKLLVSDRLRDVNPQHPQILSDKVVRAIESDPAIKKALDYYKTEVKPDIEAWRQRAGLDVSKAQTFGERGISLIPTTAEVLPATPGFASVRRLPRTTRFAKAAEGMAAQYSTNLRDVMNTSYVEAIKAARVREFYQMVKDKAISDPEQKGLPQYEDLPPALRHDITAATQPELNQMPIASNPNFGLKTKAWDLAKKFGGDLQKINTAISLTANPAAAIFHMKRVLNIAASRPPIGMGVVARLEALAPYFGPKLGTFKRVVMQDASTPQFQEILKDITDSGGGSIRPFQKYQSNVPIIKNIQAYTHEMLFGVPKGTGMKGWDLRMRVAMEQVRRSVEGNKDPQRIREFANQMGQYGSQSSWLVHYARKLNPFAGTSFPMVGTELKGSVGGSGLQAGSVTRSMALRAETVLRGTGGTILALSAANQLLSGKWPWENAKGHEFDLNTGVKNKDGQDIYASMRFIDPMLQRAVSVASIPVLSRETAKARPDYVSAAMQGPANQLTSLVNSPLATSAVKLTGKVPYWERPYSGAGGLEWMQNPGSRLTPEEKAQGKSQGVRNIKSAILGLNPITENIFGDQLKVDVPGALGYMEEPVTGIRPFGNVFSTTGEPKQGSGGGRAFSHGSRSGSTRGSSRGSRRRR